MTRPKTGDIKWSAIRQSQRHRCRTDGWVFLIAMRSKQARYKCGNSATGADTTLAVPRHDTRCKRVSGHDERGRARPPAKLSGPHPLPCPVDRDEALPPLAFATGPSLGPM